MSRLKTQIFPAPKGVDMVSDPYSMAPDMCPMLTGILPMYNGRAQYTPVLTPKVQVNSSVSLFQGISGMGYYQANPNLGVNQLLVTQYDGTLQSITKDPVTGVFTDTPVTYDTSLFTLNKRNRMIQFRDEMVILDDGNPPLRYDGSAIHNLGMISPPSPVPTAITSSGSSTFTAYAGMPQNWDGVTAPAVPAGWTFDAQYIGTTTAQYYSSPNSLDCFVASGDNHDRAAIFATLEGNLNEQVSAYFKTLIGNSVYAGVNLRSQNTAGNYGYVAALQFPSQTLVLCKNSLLNTPIATAQIGDLEGGGWWQITMNNYNGTISVALWNSIVNGWLLSNGQWSDTFAYAIVANDTSISATGYGGILTNGSNATVYYDNFTYGTTSGSSMGLKAGTYSYKFTDLDSKDRESSASVSVDVAVTSPNNAVSVVVQLGSDEQVVGGNLYVNTDGGSVWYLLSTFTGTPNQSFTFVDVMSDSQMQFVSQTAPQPGQNDPPYPANFGIFWNNRLILSDTKNPSQIQISNVGSPTQFASIQPPGYDSFGMRLNVSSSEGDIVQGFAVMGGMLFVFKRSGIYIVQGASPSTFQVYQYNTRQCISPDTIIVCDNQIIFMSDDGVYSITYLYGFTEQKISLPIDMVFAETMGPTLNTHASIFGYFGVAPISYENSFAFYWIGKYWLVIPGLAIFVMDMTSGAWGIMKNFDSVGYSCAIVVDDSSSANWVAFGHTIPYNDSLYTGGYMQILSLTDADYASNVEYQFIGYMTHYFGEGGMSLKKRPIRFYLFGNLETIPSPGSMGLQLQTERGIEQSYVIDNKHLNPEPGMILWWEFQPTECRLMTVNLSLYGTHVRLGQAIMEYDEVNP